MKKTSKNLISANPRQTTFSSIFLPVQFITGNGFNLFILFSRKASILSKTTATTSTPILHIFSSLNYMIKYMYIGIKYVHCKYICYYRIYVYSYVYIRTFNPYTPDMSEKIFVFLQCYEKVNIFGAIYTVLTHYNLDKYFALINSNIILPYNRQARILYDAKALRQNTVP